MTPGNLRVRRATTEDLAALTALWASMRYRVEELAKKITEFQVVERDNGEVIGALGLEIVQRQGRIHSEGFTDFALADAVRPQLWERLQKLAQNQGLIRLWTQEQAPFWAHSGLAPAPGEVLSALPKQWTRLPGRWLTVQLREDADAVLAADSEFALFMQAEKARTARTFQQAKALKLLATLLAVAVLMIVLVGAFYLLRHNAALRGGH